MLCDHTELTYQLCVPPVQIKRHNQSHDETRCNCDNHSKHSRAVMQQHIKLCKYTLEVDRIWWDVQVGAQGTENGALKDNILVSGYLDN